MNNQITIRSDRKDDYTFQYKGEDVTLRAGSIISIADGLNEVVLPTCAMKIVKNLIVIKEDVKQLDIYYNYLENGGIFVNENPAISVIFNWNQTMF